MNKELMEKIARAAFRRNILENPKKITDYMSKREKHFNIRAIVDKIKEEEGIGKRILNGEISRQKGEALITSLQRKFEENSFFDAMTKDNKKRDLNKLRDLVAYKKKVYDYEECPFISRNPSLRRYDITTSKKVFRTIPPVPNSIKKYLELDKVSGKEKTNKRTLND